MGSLRLRAVKTNKSIIEPTPTRHNLGYRPSVPSSGTLSSYEDRCRKFSMVEAGGGPQHFETLLRRKKANAP